jgi:3-hydroxy-D-aspartate aldolase
MHTDTLIHQPLTPDWARSLPADLSTPCLAIHEQGVLDNLHATARACGGMDRLMPHVKTHRAPWIVELLLSEGVRAFKASTATEAEMVLSAGARHVVWAYPSANAPNIRRVIESAKAHPQARVGALLDSSAGWDIWRAALASAGQTPDKLELIVDLDPGMGRTGAPISTKTLDLARAVNAACRFGGFHVYDGHIHGSDRRARCERIEAVMENVRALMADAAQLGLSTELIAGGSYSFDVWPRTLARYVGPGSWTYSSDQHDQELGTLGWTPSAYVFATVVAIKGDRATLDAGSKAISPDKPLKDRFRWHGEIVSMSEEHVVVQNDGLSVGDRVALLPRHACTTAYLYDRAIVLGRDGQWTYREQLGGRR